MPQLRIGLIAHDWAQVEPWVHRLIAHISRSDNLQLATLISAESDSKSRNENWIYKLVYPLERAVFARPIPADNQPVQDWMSAKPVIKQSDADAISSQTLDVIVCVDPNSANSENASLARYGLWYLRDLMQNAFSAAIGDDAVAFIDLVGFLDGKIEPRAIAQATINPKFLMSRNVILMKEKAVVLILRELNRLNKYRVITENHFMEGRSAPRLGTGKMIKYCLNAGKQFVARGAVRLKQKTGIRPNKFILISGRGNALDFDPKAGTQNIPDGNNFWADPFLWERDSRTFCFYEHLSRARKIGYIQVGELVEGQINVLGDALKTNYHLSFPFLFEENGELFMMPETCANKRVEIWRCTDFPLKWELHSTALDGFNAADSMILRLDQKWWLFTNISTDVYDDNCSELHLFQIDGPSLTKLTPHAGNPVVMDSRTARNAGRFHKIDGQLIRPSQDNSHGQYGYGLNMMVVEELNLENYRERLVRRIDPEFDPTIAACHHFDQVGDCFIMDAMKTS